MTSIKAIIFQEQTSIFLEKLIEKHCPMITIIANYNSLKNLKPIIKLKNPDVVFIDFFSNSELVFKSLDEDVSSETKIIFISESSKFSIKVFKYNVYGYLIKPVNPKYLKIAINKVTQDVKGVIVSKMIRGFIENRLQSKFYNSKIALKQNNEVILINISSILYFKSLQKKQTCFHLANNENYTVKKSIGEYAKHLKEPYFFRIHHSYVVNVKYIKKINRSKDCYCEISNGVILPVAKRRLTELINMFPF
jgi:two-component system LytT family response regulator